MLRDSLKFSLFHNFMASLLIDVVPLRQIQNDDLMKAFGFKTEVSVDDCLSLLQCWGSNNQVLEAR